MRSAKKEVVNLSRPLKQILKKAKIGGSKLETVKPGFTVYDKKGNKFNVSRVEYRKTGRFLKEAVAVTLKLQGKGKVPRIQKVSMKDLTSRFKTFHSKEMLGIMDSEPNTSPLPVTFYSEKTPPKEKESPYNNIFQDQKPTPMAGIIAAIQEQIKKEALEKNRRESNLTMTYNSIQNKFNGFIARSGWFSEKISSAIIFIDWLGEECDFEQYKKTSLEKNKDYNVVIVYNRNKAKSLFINVLKSLILKYPKNGGK